MPVPSAFSDEDSRFRRDAEWFISSVSGSICVTTIGGTAERLLELYLELIVRVAQEVDLAIVSVRNDAAWRGDAVAVRDIVQAFERARLELVAYGGVEVTVSTDEDQVSLTPELGIVIYARTARWAEVLRSFRVLERQVPPPSVWRLHHVALTEVGALTESLAVVVDRLQLRGLSRVEDELP